MYKISICIPTYNGQETLSETLDSLIKEIGNSSVEIVINDDKSTDNTLLVAKQYAEKYQFISVAQNEQNLRMDRNFAATALKAKGEYVWFCGQDDILQNGIVKKANDIIDKYDGLNFIYFNYKFVDDGLTTEVMPPILNIENDMYFESMEAYFEVIDHAPSFLPAVFMKKEFWDTTDYEQYFDTYYVQTGVWLENLHKGKVFVVSDPNNVLCRVPLHSWKNDDGQMIFSTSTGRLKTSKIAFNNKKIPAAVYYKKEWFYIKRFILSIIAGKSKGLIITQEIKDDFKFIFNNKFLLAYIYLISSIPQSIAKKLYFIGRELRFLFRKYTQ